VLCVCVCVFVVDEEQTKTVNNAKRMEISGEKK